MDRRREKHGGNITEKERQAESLKDSVLTVVNVFTADRLYLWSDKLAGIEEIELHVLIIIERNPEAILKEVREVLGIPNSTLTHTIDRMERNGLIKRVISPRDRRSYGLKLTKKGWGVRQEQDRILKMVITMALDFLDSDDERATLARLIGKIAGRMDPSG